MLRTSVLAAIVAAVAVGFALWAQGPADRMGCLDDWACGTTGVADAHRGPDIDTQMQDWLDARTL